MKERVTKLLSVLFITSSLLVALFPFSFVYADSSYYSLISGCNSFTFSWNTGSDFNVTVNKDNSNDIRVVMIKDGIDYNLVLVSLSSFSVKINKNSTSCTFGSSYTNSDYDSYLNAYFVRVYTNHYYTYVSGTVPMYENSNIDATALYYTFGNGAVDPEPELNYGDLIIDGYKTDIAGQGEASINNVDHILWNGFVDTNGNDISNLEVRLQIVPGTYTSDSKAHLLEQTYEDLIIDINSAHEQVYDASLGEVSFKWSDIVDMLNITPYKLWSLQLFGVDWQKEGWIYRIRLEDSENEYVGNWQTIYSSTSSGVQNDLTIINSTSIDQTYITALQEVNNLNTVNNNWTVNNTEISVTNEYTEPQQGEKPWWAYLLESILNTFNITNNYIYEGDSNTQNITNTVNDSDDDMNRKIGEYQQFEDTFIDDMDSNLTDIDTDIDFLSDNKFIASANWVAQQYNRITTNNVIGSFIGFSLLFGLALIFIGKIH